MLILHRFKWSISNTPFGELSFAIVLFRLGKDKPEVSSALGFFVPLVTEGGKACRRAMPTCKCGKEVLLMQKLESENGKRRVYCAYIVRNGKRIYPKHGKCFSFLVDE